MPAPPQYSIASSEPMSPMSWYYVRQATQPHLRQPADDDGGRARAQCTENRQDVGGERSDGDHDALRVKERRGGHLRKRSASRGVLKETELRRGEVECRLIYGEEGEREQPSGTVGRSLGVMRESVLIHWSSGQWTPLREKKDFMLSSILA